MIQLDSRRAPEDVLPFRIFESTQFRVQSLRRSLFQFGERSPKGTSRRKNDRALNKVCGSRTLPGHGYLAIASIA